MRKWDGSNEAAFGGTRFPCHAVDELEQIVFKGRCSLTHCSRPRGAAGVR